MNWMTISSKQREVSDGPLTPASSTTHEPGDPHASKDQEGTEW